MTAGARRATEGAMLVHLEITGPFVTDYSPRVRRLTRWQLIIAYLQALYR